jgi:hypothetical protein
VFVIAVLTSSVNSPICSSAPVENGGSLVVEAGRDPQIVGTANVVLPNWLADELCSSGEGTIALSLGERHSLVSMHRTTNEHRVERLHSLLQMAYASAFC